MARDKWIEIEHYGTKDNIALVEKILEHKLFLTKSEENIFLTKLFQ